MGLLIEGRWKDRWYDTESTGGRFVRQEDLLRLDMPTLVIPGAQTPRFPREKGRKDR